MCPSASSGKNDRKRKKVGSPWKRAKAQGVGGKPTMSKRSLKGGAEKGDNMDERVYKRIQELMIW